MAEEHKTRQYRFIGTHAEVLPDGRPIGPGDLIDLTDEEVRHSFYEDLIAGENLIGTEDEAQHQATLASRRVERRSSSASNDEGKEQ